MSIACRAYPPHPEPVEGCGASKSPSFDRLMMYFDRLMMAWMCRIKTTNDTPASGPDESWLPPSGGD
ncbi:MAG: hypothetical protein HYX78_09805 [Armatimonadetes bacterium]|nr:hypothetical protein [Armatimonadota bacterium]